MFRISKELNFSAAHALRGHHGGCENLHGHNWRVRATVQADELDDMEMVIDYKDLKTHLAEVLSPFDHRFLNEAKPFDKQNPTSENIARHIFLELSKRVNNDQRRVLKVEVWETPKNRAEYRE